MAITDDDVAAKIRYLSSEYLIQKHIKEKAEAKMEHFKEEMVKTAGLRDDLEPVVFGDEQVIYSVRSASRKPNAVALQKLGVPKEEFGTFRPTMTAFWKMAKARKWGEEYASRFIIDSGEKVPYVSVRRISDEEEAE